MQSFIKNYLVGTVLALVACLSFQACTTIDGQTELIAKTAVQFAVLKITDKHPEKAARILTIAAEVQAVVGTDGVNTVDALVAVIKTKANFSKLDPATQLLAGDLIDEIGIQLKQRVGSGVITSAGLLQVNQIAGWITDAAKLATVQPNV